MNSRKFHSVSVVTGAGLQRQQRRATEGTSVRCVMHWEGWKSSGRGLSEQVGTFGLQRTIISCFHLLSVSKSFFKKYTLHFAYRLITKAALL